MTKCKLLATASIGALVMTFATVAIAEQNGFGRGGPHDFANLGDGTVLNGNFTNGGDIDNHIDANSHNSYTYDELNVTAENHQKASTKGSINTSGGYNYQDGGYASASAYSSAHALNVNLTNASGGNANQGSAEATNSADTDGSGGLALNANSGTALQIGLASGHATSDNDGSQTATATNGANNAGDGGSSTNTNTTSTGTTTATANGGDTSGSQTANGGAISSGMITVSGLDNAAGAFAMTFSTGAFAAGNAANAIAANVGTININTPE